MCVQTKSSWPEQRLYIGTGREIVLQGFHWGSHRGGVDPVTRSPISWYQVIRDTAGLIREAGFNWIWLPPPSDSLAPEGYIPRRWNVLNSAYGTEAELHAAIKAIGPVRAMADVVLNHRVGAHTPGADFEDPPFADNRAAIARDDASGVGTGNHDTGEHHPAGRDLDHTNHDVRTAIKSYLERLQEVGFKGWRYDLVKGYHGRFVREYNEASAPELSIGEFFDGDRQRLTNWLDATGGNSTAFDFPTRYLLYDACMRDDYHNLRTTHHGRAVPGGLLGIWPSRAVTFLDNHDTEARREQEPYHSEGTRHFPGAKVDMGYAYLLTHPGVPCVFWPHFFDWGSPTQRRLAELLKVRRSMGLHSRSHVDIYEAKRDLYAAQVDGRVAVKLGSQSWHPGRGWHMAVDGERFAVWVRG